MHIPFSWIRNILSFLGIIVKKILKKKETSKNKQGSAGKIFQKRKVKFEYSDEKYAKNEN